MNQRIQELYDAATGNWTGADWTHQLAPICDDPRHYTHIPCPSCKGGGMVDEDGEPIYCEGGDRENCQTCSDAALDAGAAEEFASLAMTELAKDDLDAAKDAAKNCYNLEYAYGDAAVWGDFNEAIQELNSEPTEYQVDSDMLTHEWIGTDTDLREFCEILQEIVGDGIEIVAITTACNGAANEDFDLVSQDQWNKAIEKHVAANPDAWKAAVGDDDEDDACSICGATESDERRLFRCGGCGELVCGNCSTLYDAGMIECRTCQETE